MPLPSVGVGVMIREDDQILLIHRASVHGAGTWSTPGGHLDFGESIEDCAIREVWEETGLRVGKVRFRAVTNDIFSQEGKHYITIWMDAEDVQGEATVHAPGELSEVRWFSAEALPEPLFLPLKNLLEGNHFPVP